MKAVKSGQAIYLRMKEQLYLCCIECHGSLKPHWIILHQPFIFCIISYVTTTLIKTTLCNVLYISFVYISCFSGHGLWYFCYTFICTIICLIKAAISGSKTALSVLLWSKLHSISNLNKNVTFEHRLLKF